MKLRRLLAVLVLSIAVLGISAAEPVSTAGNVAPLVASPELLWLQSGASCTGQAGGAEIFVPCPGQTASQCCQTAQASYPGFFGTCEGDAEILC